MKAVTWHGQRDVRVDDVPDPVLQEPTDAIVQITSTAICGSDLHLYEVLGPYLATGDILGHEPMGIVQEVGSGVGHIAPGDRVVDPFTISCGHCTLCGDGLQSPGSGRPAVRRGGTVSISGVYGGAADPMPMMAMFDKQVQLRMGQCNVRKWIGDLLPLVEDPTDPLGVLDLTTHQLPLDEAPAAYKTFQEKADNCIKVVLKP